MGPCMNRRCLRLGKGNAACFADVDRQGHWPGDGCNHCKHCNHCSHCNKHNSNHFSVHQRICSATRDLFPICFTFQTSATVLCGTSGTCGIIMIISFDWTWKSHWFQALRPTFNNTLLSEVNIFFKTISDPQLLCFFVFPRCFSASPLFRFSLLACFLACLLSSVFLLVLLSSNPSGMWSKSQQLQWMMHERLSTGSRSSTFGCRTMWKWMWKHVSFKCTSCFFVGQFSLVGGL